MNDDRILGELQEFKRATLDRLDNLCSDVAELKAFRYKALGAAIFSGMLMTAIVEVVARAWAK